MKTKYYLFLGCLSLCLFACQEDVLDTSTSRSQGKALSRSSMGLDCELFISYQKETKSYLSSAKGESLDDCLYDIVSNSTDVVKQAIETCLRKRSTPCTKITDISSRGLRRGKETKVDEYRPPHIKTMEICNGQSVVTTSEGETTVHEVENSNEQTMHMFSSLIMTQEEIDSTMTVFVKGLDAAGAHYEISGNYLTVTETADDGSTYTVLYDIKNGVVIGETLTDNTGAIEWSKSNAYTCTDDGRLIIDFSKTVEALVSYYCDKEITKTEVTDYSNFSIN